MRGLILPRFFPLFSGSVVDSGARGRGIACLTEDGTIVLGRALPLEQQRLDHFHSAPRLSKQRKFDTKASARYCQT
jgi:hypothetical protein